MSPQTNSNPIKQRVMKYLRSILLGLLIVPLDNQEQKWHSLAFRKIPANKIKFAAHELTIEVNRSAAPLIYKFDKPIKISKIKISGQKKGSLSLTGKQGDKGQDDILLRVGFVREGQRSLNFFQKKMAPEWVLKMHELAPKNSGVSHIDFLCVYSDPQLKSTQRLHPLSELFKEHFVWPETTSQNFSYEYKFQSSESTLGLWISADGDDTQSVFEIKINKIELEFD
jgi:hypothetical protein